jgi:hypothetical protein
MSRWLFDGSIAGAFVGVVLILALRMSGAADAPPPPTAIAPADPREAWALDLLARLGNTQPTQGTIDFVIEWTLAEDSGGGAFARHNPLNTTQTGFNETHTINGDGVRGYASYEDGMQATLQTLSYGYYTEIVAGLQTNDPERAKQGLFNSRWAESRYGYGASWPRR